MSERDCEKCKHHTEKGCDSWDCKFEQEMTRKEAIDELCRLLADCYSAYPTRNNAQKGRYRQAVKIAINSLEIDERYELEYEQIEPCDDAISKQAVLELIADYDLSMGQVVKGIHALPPVTPQQKYGKWIRIDKDKCKCDQCEVISFIAMYPNGDANYCPNCGAKMQEIIDKHKTEAEEAQEPKTGRWREDIDNNRKWDRVRFYCSECGGWQTYGKTGFCPNCGVKMEESEE